MSKVSLTPFSKVVIGLAITAGFGAAIYRLVAPYHLLDLDRLHHSQTQAAAPSTSSSAPASPAAVPAAPVAPPGKAIGTPDNPLRVSLVSFHGYAPALLANGGLTTHPDSIFAKKGLTVQFILQDDVPTITTVFQSNTAHCVWRTSDFWAQEMPNLRNVKGDARAIMIVDNTQGADAIITNDPSVNSVEDLAGKTIALLQYTPSHGLTIDAIKNSSLSARKQESIKYVFVNADEGTTGVRAAFSAKQVSAAALWDPDLSLALKAVPGSKVIYSTKVATNLIYDVLVCNQDYLKDPANTVAFENLVAGWLEGVDATHRDLGKATDVLIENEQFFGLLAKNEGKEFIQGLFKNLALTNLEDNVRILGLAGGPNHYERVFRKFDEIYRAAGALANPSSPVIAPQDSFDYRFIKALAAKQPAAVTAAKKPEFDFSNSGQVAATAKTAVETKPVLVNFATGSASLTKAAEAVLDKQFVPLIESDGSAYFRISGNTDSTGNRASNLKLSTIRAKAVVDYLVAQWEFPRARFQVVGQGSDQPLCNEAQPEDGLSLDDCRARNRTTRIAVFAR